MPHGVQGMDTGRLQHPVAQRRFHTETEQIFGQFLPFTGRQGLINGIVSQRGHQAFMGKSQIGTPHRLTRQHLLASPSPGLRDRLQNGFQTVGIPAVVRHQISQSQIIRPVEVVFLQCGIGHLTDVRPTTGHASVRLYTCLGRFHPFFREEQRRMVDALPP